MEDTIHILSGNGRRGTSNGTSKISATFNHPFGICALPDRQGTLVVTDSQSNTLRFISSPSSTSSDEILKRPKVYTLENSSLLDPRGLCVTEDGKCLIVCDTGHHKIKIVSLDDVAQTRGIAAIFGSRPSVISNPTTTGCISFHRETYQHAAVSTFAGCGRKGFTDGDLLSECKFNSPSACAVNTDGSIIIADTGNHAIRCISFNANQKLIISTVAGGGKKTLSVPEEKQYVYSEPHFTLRSPRSTGGTTISAKKCGYENAPSGENALFRSPMGVCCSPSGEIIVADTFNHCIRLLTPDGSGGHSKTWKVSTIAGSPRSGHQDGKCKDALFNQPTGVCFASDGSLFVSDKGNMCIRQLGGGSSSVGSSGGRSSGAFNRFQWVRTISIDERANSRLFPDGVEPALKMPKGVCALTSSLDWYNGVDNTNNTVIGVADTGNHMIRVVSLTSTEERQGGKPKKALRRITQPIIEDIRPPEAAPIVSEEVGQRVKELEEENESLRSENAQYKSLLCNVAAQLEELAELQVVLSKRD